MDPKSTNSHVACEFSSDNFSKIRQGLRWDELIFARQLQWSSGPIRLPETGDRVSSILDAIENVLLPIASSNAFSFLSVNTPDFDDLKTESKFCASITRPIERGMNALKLLPKGKGAQHLPRLHLVLTSKSEVWPCFADVGNSALSPTGVPRLKFPVDAPSRSTLKLDEAFLTFMTEDQRSTSLASGMTAVDLGASPGGWTYQLVKRGLRVIAVDNGPMAESLMSSGLVEHRRDDAFRYLPEQRVDWLVCDVVEQPSKIAQLIADWIVNRRCKNVIFNLKLPMKKRYSEVKSCLSLITGQCNSKNIKIHIKCKQLFHDRKEVTVYIST